LALNEFPIPSDVYAWSAVFILPINSALNPFLYTVTAIVGKQVKMFGILADIYIELLAIFTYYHIVYDGSNIQVHLVE
jgi:hypothetical protein